MIFNSHIEQVLVEVGYNNLTMEQKNLLITNLAMQSRTVYSDITEEYILNHHRKLKISLLSERCEEAILKGFKSINGYTYRTNRDDQVNMIGQRDELLFDEAVVEVYWKTEDAGVVIHTRDEWIAVYKEAYNHKKSQILKYHTLKQQVLDAVDDDAVLAVDWNTPTTEAGTTTEPVSQTA